MLPYALHLPDLSASSTLQEEFVQDRYRTSLLRLAFEPFGYGRFHLYRTMLRLLNKAPDTECLLGRSFLGIDAKSLRANPIR